MVFNESPNTCSLQPVAEVPISQVPARRTASCEPTRRGLSPEHHTDECRGSVLLRSPLPATAHLVQHRQANSLRTTLHSPGISSPHGFGQGTARPLALLPSIFILYLTVPGWIPQILGEIMVLQLSTQSWDRVRTPLKADSLVRQRVRKTKA